MAERKLKTVDESQRENTPRDRGVDPLALSKDTVAEIRFGDILTFLAVRRFGSITGAARELKVTPSQVSKAIARLEDQLDVTLLARGARGVTVSEKALRVIPHLEALVERLRFLRSAEAARAPVLAVAAPSYLGVFMPRLVRAVPDLRIRGLQMATSLIRALASEELFEVALLVGPGRLPNNWVSEEVGMLRSALFGSPQTAKALGTAAVAVDRVRELTFIAPVHSFNGQYVPVDDDCPLAYGDRKLGHESQTFGLGLELAAATDQVVFGPAIAAQGYIARGELVEIKVEGWNVNDALTLACNGDRVTARAQKAIIATLREGLTDQGG